MLAIPFADLYAEAKQVQDRILLLGLAKAYHIRKRHFAEAATLRDMEKTLKDDVERESATPGAHFDALRLWVLRASSVQSSP